MADWLIALVTLSILEIILGVDNIIFIAILAGKLPEQQDRARSSACWRPWCRLLLLLCITWLMQAEIQCSTSPTSGYRRAGCTTTKAG